MAKILYGVAGEGSGHSSRAKEIIRHLEKNKHIVKVVSYDKGFKNLSPHFDVEKIFGLHFSFVNNKVEPIGTIFKNLIKLPEAIESIARVKQIVKDFKPNIIFSDFEPISAIVANLKKIPLISIDNQHRITKTKIEYPKKYKKDALAAKAVTDLMIIKANAYLVTTFFNAKTIDKKTFIFPPILRDKILKKKITKKDFILVYVTSEFDELTDILKKINKKFIVYGFNENRKEENLIFKKASQDGFLNDLASCEAIVANAGFTLITEALHLQKPYLALPVKGQFEQVLNGYYLEKLNYGKYWDSLNKEKIESFLFNLDLYRENLKKYEKNDNSKILEKIDELV
ncbi:teichoic acid biosynthesis protein, partial [Candidatus Parcubacteria bacterium]|nr:teichoic acid biosynthesis protein [Candidatus Parcubacteria bacterium]